MDQISIKQPEIGHYLPDLPGDRPFQDSYSRLELYRVHVQRLQLLICCRAVWIPDNDGK